MIHASFSDLTPVNPGVRGQLLDNWSAYWESEAEQTLVEYELAKTRILNKARIQAQINLKDTLMKLLQSSSLADDALALRMLQALEGVAADPATRKFLPPETITMLNSIWDWLLTEDQLTKLQSGMYPGFQPGAGMGGITPVVGPAVGGITQAGDTSGWEVEGVIEDMIDEGLNQDDDRALSDEDGSDNSEEQQAARNLNSEN